MTLKCHNGHVRLLHVIPTRRPMPSCQLPVARRAAVYFEMGEFEKSIVDCDAAVEKGRSLRVDYKMIARALTRKGNCLVKMGNLAEAINIYQKALTEHR